MCFRGFEWRRTPDETEHELPVCVCLKNWALRHKLTEYPEPKPRKLFRHIKKARLFIFQLSYELKFWKYRSTLVLVTHSVVNSRHKV